MGPNYFLIWFRGGVAGTYWRVEMYLFISITLGGGGVFFYCFFLLFFYFRESSLYGAIDITKIAYG